MMSSDSVNMGAGTSSGSVAKKLKIDMDCDDRLSKLLQNHQKEGVEFMMKNCFDNMGCILAIVWAWVSYFTIYFIGPISPTKNFSISRGT